MALLLSGTRVYGNTNIDSVLVVGNTTPFAATSNSTGSLRVTGGAGITGNLYTSQIYVTDSTDSSSNSTGSLVVTGGLGVGKTLFANTIGINSGTLTVAPLNFSPGANLTTAASGSVEFTGNLYFHTANTTAGQGRGIVLSPQFGRLAANASVASGGAFFTNTIRPALQNGQWHHFKYFLVFQKATAGTVTYSFTPSTGTFTNLHAHAVTYVQGQVLAAVTNMASISTVASATTNSSASASLTNNSINVAIIEGFVVPSADCRLQLNVTCSSGTVTAALGSNFIVTSLGSTNIGNIA
jgi:hypothetical protein